MRLARLLFVALGLSPLAGCPLTIDDSRLGGGDAATIDGTALVDAMGNDAQVDAAGIADADGSGDAPRCPSGMLAVPALVGGDYCIDATEVTHDAYAAFLAVAPAPSNQPAECAWNTSYQPAQWDAAADPAMPVHGVDWCDAYAYCASVSGRHLCGAIGGGPVEYQTGIYDPTKSEWYGACSHEGQIAFPYGGSYVASLCNGADYDAGAAAHVGSIATCVGGFPGIFDMSGNVEEWTSSCTSGAATCTVGSGHQCDLCRGLGGAYDTPASFLPCKGGDQFYRAAQFTDTGLRCCGD